MNASTHLESSELIDVAVIGGSAAGLAAALQLARQERSVVVLDDQTPRNAPASHLHGYVGFDGRPPAELVAAGRRDASAYGVEFVDDRVVSVRGDHRDGFAVTGANGANVTARRLLVASGLIDELPAIDGLAEHWGHGVIHCPFCHGFEHRGERHVHLATIPPSLHPASLFAHLAGHLTVVIVPDCGVDTSSAESLRAAGATIVTEHVARVLTRDGAIAGVELVDGRTLDADVVSVTPRVRARIDVLGPLGLEAVPHPMEIGDHVATDATGQTSVDGVYAAGNVTDPSHQLLQAAADGGRVGAMIAFDLAAA